MDKNSQVEMKFCRRCGSGLTQQGVDSHVFKCERNHILFANADPAVGVALYNDQGEVIVLERGIDPGKGRLDLPGGFCDGAETFESACARELQEEVGIRPDQYEALEYVLSGIDMYDYKGETLQVLSVIFKARLTERVEPKADDDAASAEFVPLQDIDLEKIYFPSIRQALLKMRDEFVD